MKALIVHHAWDDTPAQPGHVGVVSRFAQFLRVALHGCDLELKLLEGFPAGTSEDVKRDYARNAHLVVYAVSIDFILHPLCMEIVDDLGSRKASSGQKRVGILLKACGYENLLGGLTMFPNPAQPILNGGQNLDQLFTSIARDIAAQLQGAVLEPAAAASSLGKEPAPVDAWKTQKSALARALASLNYELQPEEFEQAISAARHLPTAFLVHGRVPPHGDRWLRSKLLRLLPDPNPTLIEIDARGADCHLDFARNGFLQQLAGRLFPSRASATYERIRNELYCRLLEQEVTYVIQITGVMELLLSTELSVFQDFRSRFWDPLVNDLRHEGAALRGRLILFFVAEEGLDQCRHFVPYTAGVGSPQPILLQRVDALDEALISAWLNRKAHLLTGLPKPTALADVASRQPLVNDLLAKTKNGWPEMVLQYICRDCGCEFDEILNLIPQ